MITLKVLLMLVGVYELMKLCHLKKYAAFMRKVKDSHIGLDIDTTLFVQVLGISFMGFFGLGITLIGAAIVNPPFNWILLGSIILGVVTAKLQQVCSERIFIWCLGIDHILCSACFLIGPMYYL